jgi:Family of unknown function (DUF6978)
MRRLGVTVSDPVVEAVFDPSARLVLQVPVRWKDRPGTVRGEMAVSNVRALPLLVGMQVTKDKPWKPTVYLMLENEQLRRLDINGSHTNRIPPREQWVRRTHKHLWSEAHHDAIAYTPSDIPGVAVSNVTGEQLREVFEAFLAECHIETRGAYRWSDPTLTFTATGRLGVS